jgi:hypothetical protein
VVVPAAEPAKLPAAANRSYETVVLPLVKQYCLECHSGADAEQGVRLDKYATIAAMSEDRATWRKVLGMLRTRKMPPKENRRPSDEQYGAASAWLEVALDRADRTAPADPGRVTIRRLNRAEYTNTVRDLLGVEFDAAADFPSDDVGYGFDNIGDVLTLPPLLMEKYLNAAEQLAAKAIAADKRELKHRILVAKPGAKLSPEAAVEQVLRRLATRAYRRPVSDKELARLVQLAATVWRENQGGGLKTALPESDRFQAGMQLALQAILVSPHFLFRAEIDPEAKPGQQVRTLNEYELASRLSYFLWSSMPDDELFDLAARGKLREELKRQVRRMLGDRKSKALVENFAGQWLQLRNLDLAVPDKSQFPGFDQDLRRAMRTEAEMVFEAVMREDRSVLELLDADYTFVNARLARHYGLQGVAGDEFRRVSLRGPQASARGGVLTQAAMLTVTSNPGRTSPVKRGKWILQNILGTPPPNPPANVPMLDDGSQAVAAGTLRQRMEQHRKDVNCAVCHKEMDALGFALENFDAVGAWRTKDGKFPIDAAAQLPDGRSFNGPRELKAVLRGNSEQFARCLAEKLLTYALGRGIESYDRRTVDAIVGAAKASDYKFSTFIQGIVHSDPFQKTNVGWDKRAGTERSLVDERRPTMISESGNGGPALATRSGPTLRPGFDAH